MLPGTKEIEKKRRGYASQDKKWNIFSERHFVTTEHVESLLRAANMKCGYCDVTMLAVYEARDRAQWTLDRVDNDYGHNMGNVLVCCLRCNLQRRSRDSKKFAFSKQLVVTKLDASGNVDGLP
jgi:hypothetical protein